MNQLGTVLLTIVVAALILAAILPTAWKELTDSWDRYFG